MSKIEDLIKQYCPNGVKFKELGEILDYEQPSKYIVKSTRYENEGTPVLTAGQTFILGYTSETDGVYMASKNNPVIIFDDFTTSFHWVDFDFKVKSSAIKMLRPKQDICFKYVYYTMKTIKYSTFDHSRQWISNYSKIKIPVPPMPVQEEIVKILDSYSELETKLEAKLEVELGARKKQYEYYKNKLLNSENISGEDIKFLPLSEIAYYPNKRIDARFVNEDNYVSVENLLKDKQGKTKSTSVPTQGSVIEYIENDILIGNIRPYLKKIWLATNTGGTNGDVVLVRIKNEQKQQITPDFLYHILMSEKFFDYDNQYARGAKMPRGNKDMILKYSIPLPPIEKQKRIVAILDEFNKLTNEISDSLQAEITTRKKQYEYYRNKLLTFKEAV